MSRIKIIGRTIAVVDHDGLTIHEAIGNVATHNDNVSLAIVTVTTPTSEPWLTLHYDEWMYVMEGHIELWHSLPEKEEEEEDEEDEDIATITTTTTAAAASSSVAAGVYLTVVKEGETVFIPKGSRFKPVFPVTARYIPLCIPAFSPDRCIREEEGGAPSDVAARLNTLHQNTKTRPTTPPQSSPAEVHAKYDHIRTIYHMCRTSLYQQAVDGKKAYYPPTFIQDGRLVHATANAATLLTTANHFYTTTPVNNDPWVCLELDRGVLEKKCGLVTVFEGAASVGEVPTNKNWDYVCPHIYGGLPVYVDGVVTNVYKMTRSPVDGTFLSIEGIVI